MDKKSEIKLKALNCIERIDKKQPVEDNLIERVLNKDDRLGIANWKF